MKETSKLRNATDNFPPHFRDRHLISEHNYDYCKLCRLVGPALSVALHCVLRHQDRLCHLCGGSQSPIFADKRRDKLS